MNLRNIQLYPLNSTMMIPWAPNGATVEVWEWISHFIPLSMWLFIHAEIKVNPCQQSAPLLIVTPQIAGNYIVCSIGCSGQKHKNQSFVLLPILRGESTGDRQITLTKCRVSMKRFHVMASFLAILHTMVKWDTVNKKVIMKYASRKGLRAFVGNISISTYLVPMDRWLG